MLKDLPEEEIKKFPSIFGTNIITLQDIVETVGNFTSVYFKLDSPSNSVACNTLWSFLVGNLSRKPRINLSDLYSDYTCALTFQSISHTVCLVEYLDSKSRTLITQSAFLVSAIYAELEEVLYSDLGVEKIRARDLKTLLKLLQNTQDVDGVVEYAKEKNIIEKCLKKED